MTDEAVKKKLTKARIDLIAGQPFYGTLAMRLQLVEMDAAMRSAMEARGMRPTLAVDGKRIYYAPEFIANLSHESVKTVVAHEVGHCVYQHIGRRGERNANKWNKAGDHVINLSLKNAGFSFDGEGGWLCDPQYEGMSADQVYKLLPDEPEDDGNGGGDGKGQAMCDIMDGEAKADPQLADEWKIATAQAAMAAQQAGKLPADMKRFVDELLNPKTDWRTQLRRFVTETSKDDYSWQRPNRKMLGAHGVYLPSLYSEQMGTLVIAIDTSGSITREMLNIFAGEINAIRASVNPKETIVIYCDARVNKVTKFQPEDPLELEMVGGGGTSFIPPFEYVAKKGITPQCLLYMTDGYGSAPDHPPEYPTLWCMTTDVRLPWGEHLDLDLEA